MGVVLSRLPSHANRVRLAAVCRPWRSNARLLRPLPPLLPWIALCDGTFLSLPDGAVHRLPVADDGVSVRASTGSRLFLVHGDGRCSLMNPSPSATTPLAEPEGGLVSDIAIFKGKIYALLTTKVGRYRQHELRVLDDGHEQTTIHGTLVGQEAWYDPNLTDFYLQRNYLVVSGDRLLMVEQRISERWPRDWGPLKLTRHFKVLEATDLSSSGCARWTEVDTLMGRALFVSQGCSESLPASAGGQSSGTGVEEDCIYFLKEKKGSSQPGLAFLNLKPGRPFVSKINGGNCENAFQDSGVYNMRDRTVTPLLSETVVASTAGEGPWSPTWLFPEP
ncbi:uncharacterized protein LOC119333309 [Triticum dicoccoides]|uniref:uncharacterized protein LOC119333309 n=1 Tax=Triticum dicoccoides TaxID=85692 RepID=UPI0018919A65|nr:uncharacterized protein LOC119333309 [Triticum dicoccoides]